MAVNGYVRQSSGSIVALAKITSAMFNNEYNALQTAFDSTSGHNHDITVTGAGAAIDLTKSVTGTLPIANGGTNAITAAAARVSLGVDPVGTDTGTANVYVVTLSGPAITAYANGHTFRYLPLNANNGPSTVAVSGLSAVPIVKQNNVALATGDIVANQLLQLTYVSAISSYVISGYVTVSSFFGTDFSSFSLWN